MNLSKINVNNIKSGKITIIQHDGYTSFAFRKGSKWKEVTIKDPEDAGEYIIAISKALMSLTKI